ncbi:hypothetical protein KC318_g16119 [Hortaea werneckii]|nr:hypothetical protein KC334_g12401 [Hortaea werneckii]KAI6967769.1 hypothetical protein KC355_g12033 [Hortaea werneckii]KAI7650870.1 hypothetical protein KC318_g16119 [Hortaea werneckii]
MEDNQKHNQNPDNQNHTATDNQTTLRQPHASTHPEKLSAQDQQHPPTTPDPTTSAAGAAAQDLPIIDRRRPSEAETKLLREYGGKENLREKTKFAYNERDIDPGADTPQEEKSFAEGVVGEMDVEAHERKFHLDGFEKGVKKSGRS